MKRVQLIWERTYPYLVPALCTGPILKFSQIDFFASVDLNDALTAIITVTSIIIGFMGAMLPVILSMKNDSKIVKYVFQKDKHMLFLEYIKGVFGIGLGLIMFSIVPYFRDQFINTTIYKFWQYLLIYTLISFLCATYRCLNNMLNLVFKSDVDLKNRDDMKPSPEKQKMDMQLKEEQENADCTNIK